MPRNYSALGQRPGVNIDIEGLVMEIEERAVAALNTTLNGTLKLAQKHAPVRAIFGRTRRGGKLPSIRIAKGASRAEVIRAYRRHPLASGRRYQSFKDSRAPNRRINVPADEGHTYSAREMDRAGIPHHLSLTEFSEEKRIDKSVLSPGPAYGHNNSLFPVNRSKGETIAGDFRQYSERLKMLLPVKTAVQVKGGKPTIEVMSAEDLLTKRGRYEVATGRAAFRSGETVRIGGALRGSIIKIDATPHSTLDRGQIIGYVRAGNEDVDYAGYQEFGTRRNRPHPFLRPALYESRGPFKKNVSNALKRIRKVPTRG